MSATGRLFPGVASARPSHADALAAKLRRLERVLPEQVANIEGIRRLFFEAIRTTLRTKSTPTPEEATEPHNQQTEHGASINLPEWDGQAREAGEV